jgi:Flp pilus assembly protein CpaB
MRRGRIFFYLAAILILVLGGAFVVWQRFLQPSPAPAEGAPPPTPVVDLVQVVVVTQPTPRGAELDETVLGMIEIPRDVLIEGMFTDVALVVGRQAKFDLDSGIPLTASMLVDTAEQLSRTGSLAALSIPRGKVAISMPIGRLSSISYAPRPGDHVGVIATMLFVDIDSEFQTILPNQVGGVQGPAANEESGTNTLTIQVSGGEGNILGRTELDPILNELTYVVPSETQRPRLVSQFVLYDVEVLQVGEFPLEAEEEVAQEQAEAAVAEGEAPAAPKIEKPTIITLIVSPQDAVAVNYLLYNEVALTLVLRASGDDTAFTTEAATLQYMLDVYNIPAPAKLPYSIEPRIDILNITNTEKSTPATGE